MVVKIVVKIVPFEAPPRSGKRRTTGDLMGLNGDS